MEITVGNEKGRIPFIDSIKGFAIFLVVLGHIFLLGESRLIISANKYIYTFHIPLFFFISGLLYRNRNMDFISFAKNKFKRLIIPYFSFSLVLYPIWILIEKYIKGTNDYKELKYFFGVFLGNADLIPWAGPLWYLISLFVVSCAFYFIGKMQRRNLVLTLFGVAALGYMSTALPFSLPWMLDTSLTALVIYGIGYLMKDVLMDSIERIRYNNIFVQITIVSTLLLIGWFFGMTNGRVNMVNNQYGNYIGFYISALSTSIGIFILFKNIYAAKKPNVLDHSLNFFGENSIVVLALHGRTMTAMGFVLQVMGVDMYQNVVYSVIYAILIIILQMPFIYIINNYLPFVLGLDKIRLERQVS